MGVIVRSVVMRFRGRLAPLGIVLGCGALAGCSADVTRFDFPSLSLTDSTTQTVPVEPVYAGAPPEPRRPAAGASAEATRSAAFGRDGGYSGVSDLTPDQPIRASRSAVVPTYGSGGAAAGGSAFKAPSTQRPSYQQPSFEQPSYQQPARRQPVQARPIEPAPRVTLAPAAPIGGTDERRYAQATTGRGQLAGSGANMVTVASGDTLYQISRRTGASVNAIMQANGLASSSIRVGQRLVIPGGGTASRPSLAPEPARVQPTIPSAPAGSDGYVVKSGDSLYGIARRNGVTVNNLVRANGITDASKLRVGQRLIIPGRSSGRQIASSGTAADTGLPQWNSGGATGAAIPQAPAARQPEPQRQASVAPQVTPEPSAGVGASTGDSDHFRWPVRGRIIRPFGPAADGSFNDGIRIAVPEGTEVRAVKDGVVAYAGDELKGYGNLILVRHEGNWVSAYAHNSSLMVERGAKISRGQVIAKAGRSGDVDQPQLHFELRKGSQPVDPMLHLASR